jgi:cytosine/adenosine deaminase-related metal-dependent hydrolase
VTAARIVEALDEFEDRTTRFGLCLEPTPIEQFAFQGCEETLAHGVVVGVADRTYRGPHACIAAAAAELDRGVLGGFNCIPPGKTA